MLLENARLQIVAETFFFLNSGANFSLFLNQENHFSKKECLRKEHQALNFKIGYQVPNLSAIYLKLFIVSLFF